RVSFCSVVRFTALHFAYLQSRPVEKLFLLVRVLTKCSCLGKQLSSMAALALVRVFTNKFCSCLGKQLSSMALALVRVFTNKFCSCLGK
ncbi:MAG: hypothetical protein NZM34_13840, partial [Bernardetiaceae bacterium]|nr:hypothetical protein [Bernardetiaceae bacterium]